MWTHFWHSYLLMFNNKLPRAQEGGLDAIMNWNGEEDWRTILPAVSSLYRTGVSIHLWKAVFLCIWCIYLLAPDEKGPVDNIRNVFLCGTIRIGMWNHLWTPVFVKPDEYGGGGAAAWTVDTSIPLCLLMVPEQPCLQLNIMAPFAGFSLLNAFCIL